MAAQAGLASSRDLYTGLAVDRVQICSFDCRNKRLANFREQEQPCRFANSLMLLLLDFYALVTYALLLNLKSLLRESL